MKKQKYITLKIICIIIFTLFAESILFSQNANELARKLSNPLGYLSVPFQNNIDFNIPPNNAFRWTMNLMPIIPFSVNKDWNSLNRIVAPFIHQKDIFKDKSQTGIGDILINAFISPKGTDIVWGIGPSIYFPCGTPLELTARKWAIGPNIIAMKSEGRLILGALFFHIWSVAGDKARPDFSYSYFQPVSLYNFNGGWGIGLSAEISNEWKKKITSGAVIFQGSKMLNIEGQLVNFVLGPKIYFGDFNRPDIGIRASINLLYP
ncbi:MAG: hypothetical protein NTU73_09870 [Ignavibacteriae bacterium]|nr:hypothetical protein [Ignavibacteriota bacterium]